MHFAGRLYTGSTRNALTSVVHLVVSGTEQNLRYLLASLSCRIHRALRYLWNIFRLFLFLVHHMNETNKTFYIISQTINISHWHNHSFFARDISRLINKQIEHIIATFYVDRLHYHMPKTSAIFICHTIPTL